MSMTFTDKARRLDLNLSNPNACALLEWLGVTEAEGLDPDWCGGRLDADVLAIRCRFRLGDGDPEGADLGMPTTTQTLDSGATLVSCGRPAGYFTEKAEALLRIAAEALTQDGIVYLS